MNALKPAVHLAMLAFCMQTAPAAQAASLDTQFEVYLVVVAACTFVSSTDVAFGSQTVVSGQQLDAYGSLRIECNLPTAYQISLDQGLHGSGVNDRRMAGVGGDTVAYQLYSGNVGATNCNDTAGAQWGNASAGCVYANSYAGTEQDIQIHGKLTIDNPRADSYSDTITATITY